MFIDTQMKGRHAAKLHTWGVLIGSHLLKIQIRRILMEKQVPPVLPVGILSGFNNRTIVLPAAPKCKKNRKDFYFKDSSWNS